MSWFARVKFGNNWIAKNPLGIGPARRDIYKLGRAEFHDMAVHMIMHCTKGLNVVHFEISMGSKRARNTIQAKTASPA
jgi:hypothetical protein